MTARAPSVNQHRGQRTSRAPAPPVSQHRGQRPANQHRGQRTDGPRRAGTGAPQPPTGDYNVVRAARGLAGCAGSLQRASRVWGCRAASSLSDDHWEGQRAPQPTQGP